MKNTIDFFSEDFEVTALQNQKMSVSGRFFVEGRFVAALLKMLNPRLIEHRHKSIYGAWKASKPTVFCPQTAEIMRNAGHTEELKYSLYAVMRSTYLKLYCDENAIQERGTYFIKCFVTESKKGEPLLFIEVKAHTGDANHFIDLNAPIDPYQMPDSLYHVKLKNSNQEKCFSFAKF